MDKMCLLIFGGALCTEGNLRFKIDWASLQLEGNLLFLLCFTLYLRVIITKYKPPGGLLFGGAISRKVFCVTSLGGLYMEGLIFRILRGKHLGCL